MRTKGNRDRLVQMLMNDHPTTRERRAQLTAFELPGLVGKTHRVIARDDALVLPREDHLQVFAPQRYESSAALTGRLTETLIELRHIFRSQKTIGLPQSFDLPGSQF